MNRAPPPIKHIEDDQQLTRILYILICAAWATYLFVILTALYFNDRISIVVTLVGSALLIVPFVLLRRKHLHASSLMVVMIVLATVTVIATVGQGIRDLAIITFPIILIFAGMTLDRILFWLSVLMEVAATCWLVFGESFGWFVTKPFNGGLTNWFYLVGVTIILLVAAMAVDLLATNVRKNLERAHNEIDHRQRVEDQLRHQSTHDILTGIYNRFFFEAELDRLVHSQELPVSIIIADVDDLKLVNDTHGHAAGDEILLQVANVLRSVFRKNDVVARIGGDEFGVLLPATDSETASQIVSRIQEKLAEHNTEYPNKLIQLSLGLATAEKNNLTEAFKTADQRMYIDKSAHKSGVNHLSSFKP